MFRDPSEIAIELRGAGPNDKEFAYQVREAAFRQYVEATENWDEEEQRRLHERRFASQDFRIICMDRQDVGIVALEVTAECLKVNQMFLLPQHQGKGIGAACMKIIMQEAKHAGLSVCLRVLKVNPRAMAFYERQGFSVTGETDSHYMMERNLE